MDLEKVKKNYKWDPMRGDYSKSYVSYERRIYRRKKIRNVSLTILYIIILIVSIIVIYQKFK
ncbi:MAG: hypothetical protein SGI89_03590 [bacterium]|nr:hypothetical protein [bacterium]